MFGKKRYYRLIVTTSISLDPPASVKYVVHKFNIQISIWNYLIAESIEVVMITTVFNYYTSSGLLKGYPWLFILQATWLAVVLECESVLVYICSIHEFVMNKRSIYMVTEMPIYTSPFISYDTQWFWLINRQCTSEYLMSKLNVKINADFNIGLGFTFLHIMCSIIFYISVLFYV